MFKKIFLGIVEKTYLKNRDKLSVWLSGSATRGVLWVAAAVMGEQAITAATPAEQIGNGVASLVLALIPFGWEAIRSKVVMTEAQKLEKGLDDAVAESTKATHNLINVVTAIDGAKAADGAVYFKDAKTLRKLNKMGDNVINAVKAIRADNDTKAD